MRVTSQGLRLLRRGHAESKFVGFGLADHDGSVTHRPGSRTEVVHASRGVSAALSRLNVPTKKKPGEKKRGEGCCFPLPVTNPERLSLEGVQKLHSQCGLITVRAAGATFIHSSIGPILANFRATEQHFGELIGAC